MTFPILALAACVQPDPNDNSKSSGSSDSQTQDTASINTYSPKTVTQQGDTIPTDGGTQSLIAQIHGDGCFVVAQNFGGDAYIQSANETGLVGNTHALPNADTWFYGHGTQAESGEIYLPFQSADGVDDGMVTLSENGDVVATHNFAQTEGLTGTGAVQDYHGAAIAITSNGIFGGASVSYNTDSSFVRFDPNVSGCYDVTPLPNVTNATGLAISGDTAIIASAGDYYNDPAAVGAMSRVDLSAPISSETFLGSASAPAGLGLNGNLAVEDGYVLTTGFNATSPIAVSDNGAAAVGLVLPDGCGENGYVLGGQFVQTDGAQMQILMNSMDYTSGEMGVYLLTGDVDQNAWQCDRIGGYTTYSGAGVMKYGTDKFCAATNDAVIFFEAQ